jgi:hypothetical protein
MSKGYRYRYSISTVILFWNLHMMNITDGADAVGVGAGAATYRLKQMMQLRLNNTVSQQLPDFYTLRRKFSSSTAYYCSLI